MGDPHNALGTRGRQRTRRRYRERTTDQENKVVKASPHREKIHSQSCGGEGPTLSTSSPMEKGPGGPEDGTDEGGEPSYLPK